MHTCRKEHGGHRRMLRGHGRMLRGRMLRGHGRMLHAPQHPWSWRATSSDEWPVPFEMRMAVMRADMRADMCIDMCIDMCMHACIGTCTNSVSMSDAGCTALLHCRPEGCTGWCVGKPHCRRPGLWHVLHRGIPGQRAEDRAKWRTQFALMRGGRLCVHAHARTYISGLQSKDKPT